MRYYDTGIIIKLYTEEPESEVVRSFVLDDGEPILINDFHLSEMTAAITLKKYRGECSTLQVERLLSSIDEDRNKGVLTFKGVDWPEAWRMCRSLGICTFLRVSYLGYIACCLCYPFEGRQFRFF